MSEKTTFVSFLLDETGSMGSIADDTVAGFNDYVATLQESDADIVFSLVSFNSNETRKRYVAEPIAEVATLRRDDYRPEAMTPLIDAAVKIVRATDEAVRHRGDDPNVVIVVQTDGLENVSVEYDNADLAKLIKEKTAAGWEFVFLGAGIDAFAAARAAGIDLHPDRVMSYGRRSTREAFAGVAANLSAYAEDGDAKSLAFSPEQRRSAKDEHAHKYQGRQPAGSGPSGGGRPSRAQAGPQRSTVEDVDLRKS